MNILFIAYYIDPSVSVGAHRILYWANNLPRMGADISVEVITAVQGADSLPSVKEVHVVPNNKVRPKVGIADEGFTWKSSLIQYIKRMKFNFDWVIMSGGPFMQFGIAKQLKAEYGVKVLLDFRDPFARNPRFNNSYLKIAVKSYYERQFIKSADQVVTVNDQCIALLKYKGITADKYAIIENGYDDTVLDKVTPSRGDNAGISMVYCGTFFEDRNPTNFLQLLCTDSFKSDFEFTHIGRHSSYVSTFTREDNVKELGLRSYTDMLNYIANADVGLIFTSGNAFESTTKIFDYIGLGMAILIVTEGGVKSGNLHKITESYPKVYWSKNDKDSIGVVLNQIRNDDLTVSFVGRSAYSRYAGLKKLASLINIEPQ